MPYQIFLSRTVAIGIPSRTVQCIEQNGARGCSFSRIGPDRRDPFGEGASLMQEAKAARSRRLSAACAQGGGPASRRPLGAGRTAALPRMAGQDLDRLISEDAHA
ncbi:hypothetical protein GCM10009527_053620 [Actinomadura nitritigenes]